jgi:hypothetical protein
VQGPGITPLKHVIDSYVIDGFPDVIDPADNSQYLPKSRSNSSSSGSVFTKDELKIHQSDFSGIRRLYIQSLSCVVVILIPVRWG